MIEKISLKMGNAEEYISYVHQHQVRESNNLDLPLTMNYNTTIAEQSSARNSVNGESSKVTVPAQVILEEGRKNAASKVSGTRPKTAAVSPTPIFG